MSVGYEFPRVSKKCSAIIFKGQEVQKIYSTPCLTQTWRQYNPSIYPETQTWHSGTSLKTRIAVVQTF